MAEATPDLVQRSLKDLSSQVRKRRGWLASDPTQADPLVDALNELTAHRILARQHTEAFPDAQDALMQANRLVAFHGAVGPFTPADDAVRFVTATAHIAAIQSTAGHAAAGAQTASALQAWTTMVPHLDLPPLLLPRTAVWILAATARGALASGDLPRANAYADAAVHRCDDVGLGADLVWAPLFAETLSLAADCRWAAGLTNDAVALGVRAAGAARRAAAPVLDAPTRATEGWIERVLPPLISAEVTLADRLAATGDRHGAASRLGNLIAVLESGRAGLGAAGRAGIAQLRSDMDDDLTSDRPTLAVPAPASPVRWANLSDADALVASTRAPSAAPAADSAWEVPDLPDVPETPTSQLPSTPADQPMRAVEPETTHLSDGDPVVERQPEPAVELEAADSFEQVGAASETAPVQPSAEDLARQALESWRIAADAGDRQGTVAAASVAVEALRPLASEQPSAWGPTLVDALERLGDARFRAGDWWGSRTPKKEAKTLARALGL